MFQALGTGCGIISNKNCMQPVASSLGVNVLYVSWGCFDFALSYCRCRFFWEELQALVQIIVIGKCESTTCNLRIR